MWVFLSTRLRTWVLLAAAVPAIHLLIRRAQAAAQRRDASGPVASALGRADTLLTKLERRRSGDTDTRGSRRRIRGARGGWL